METPTFSAVVVAGGGSRRMGFDKLTAPLCGSTVLGRSLAGIAADPRIGRIVLVAPAQRQKEFAELADSAVGAGRVKLAAGGAERAESVLNGLEALRGESDWVAIHDAARPLLAASDLAAVLDSVMAFEDAEDEISGASLAAPVSDTIHRADEALQVVASVDRSKLFGMQTPQVFCLARILEVLKRAVAGGALHTDEVGAMRAAGGRVKLVLSRHWNFKITYPETSSWRRLFSPGRNLWRHACDEVTKLAIEGDGFRYAVGGCRDAERRKRKRGLLGAGGEQA